MEASRTLAEAHLLVVESEAEVRWSWECGRIALTRTELRARLRSRLLPDVTLASSLDVRLALEGVMTELAVTHDWLAVVRERGGRAWMDLVAAMGETLAEAHRMTWHEPLSRELFGDDSKARTVAAAGRELERALARAKLVDPAAEDERLASALSLAPALDVVLALGTRHVVASGIASWLPAELASWRALDARLSLAGGSATIELVTFERPLDASRGQDPPGRLIDAVAEALDAAPRTRPITPVLGDFDASDESRARLELRTADGTLAEARAIADAVQEALSAGAPPEQIAIVCPPGAPARNATLRLLEELGIAAPRVGLDSTSGGGLVACALEALAVAGRGVPRLPFAALLRSPYLNAVHVTGLPQEPEARAAVARLARALEQTRSVAGDRPSDALARTVLRSHEDPEVRAALGSLARRVGQIFERAASGSRRAEHAENARRMLDALGLQPRVGQGTAAALASDEPLSGLTCAELVAFVRDAKGRRRLCETLDEYRAAASRLELDRPTTFESFRLELSRALREAEAEAFAPDTGAISVSSLRDLPSRPLALLVLADADADRFESMASSLTLLDATVRARLTECIEPALRPSVLASRDADAVRLASAADGARRIVVSYTKRDDDGVLRTPHSLVAWIERQGVRETRWRDKVIADPPLTTREERMARLGARLAETEPFALVPHAAERAAIEWRHERSFGITPSDGADAADVVSAAIQGILTEETGGANRPLSVTALDRFGACAFQGFAAQVLGARSKLILEEAIGPREEGVLLHGALAAAFEGTRSLWRVRPRDRDAIRGESRRAAAAFLGRDHAPSRQMRAALDEIEARVVRAVEWSLADDAWDFSLAEASFGKRADAWDAVVLDDEVTSLRLAGTIDRVDVSHEQTELRVVDYKRSEDGARRLTAGLGEESFQLAVYARAALLALGRPVTSGMYLPTRYLPPDYRTRGSDAAWTRAHAEDGGRPRFEKRALDLVATVRRGLIDPRPKSPDTCRWCDHDGACRKPRFVITSTAGEESDDPRAGA